MKKNENEDVGEGMEGMKKEVKRKKKNVKKEWMNENKNEEDKGMAEE